MSERGLYAVAAHGPVPLPLAAHATGLEAMVNGFELGVYTVFRTFHGRRFVGLDRHLARLDDSLDRIGWRFRPDHARLCRQLDKVVARAAAGELRLRIDVLAEPVMLSIGPAEMGASRELIGHVGLQLPPPGAYADGVQVRTLNAIERADPRAKTAAFALQRQALVRSAPTAFESIMCDAAGRPIEGLSSSFFFVAGGRLGTAGDGVLEGVTRAAVLQLARELAIDVVLAPLETAQLRHIDEAFLCSSARGVVPITSIDEQPVGSGRPGPVTTRLMSAYAAWIERTAAPASGTHGAATIDTQAPGAG